MPRARCQQVGTLLTCWRSIAEAATRPLDIGVFAYPPNMGGVGFGA